MTLMGQLLELGIEDDDILNKISDLELLAERVQELQALAAVIERDLYLHTAPAETFQDLLVLVKGVAALC